MDGVVKFGKGVGGSSLWCFGHASGEHVQHLALS